jgi:hypothetical protein
MKSKQQPDFSMKSVPGNLLNFHDTGILQLHLSPCYPLCASELVESQSLSSFLLSEYTTLAMITQVIRVYCDYLREKESNVYPAPSMTQILD